MKLVAVVVVMVVVVVIIVVVVVIKVVVVLVMVMVVVRVVVIVPVVIVVFGAISVTNRIKIPFIWICDYKEHGDSQNNVDELARRKLNPASRLSLLNVTTHAIT